MTDAAIKNATERRDALAAEINQLQDTLDERRKELAHVIQFIKDWSDFAGVPTPEAEPKVENPPREIVGTHAARIIELRDRPISRTELFQTLKAIDIEIRGKDPEMVLSTMMWRMQDTFVRIPGHGYWLRNRPCPAVGYKPGDIPMSSKKQEALANAFEKLI